MKLIDFSTGDLRIRPQKAIHLRPIRRNISSLPNISMNFKKNLGFFKLFIDYSALSAMIWAGVF
jgi:hypothetical protein